MKKTLIFYNIYLMLSSYQIQAHQVKPKHDKSFKMLKNQLVECRDSAQTIKIYPIDTNQINNSNVYIQSHHQNSHRMSPSRSIQKNRISNSYSLNPEKQYEQHKTKQIVNRNKSITNLNTSFKDRIQNNSSIDIQRNRSFSSQHLLATNKLLHQHSKFNTHNNAVTNPHKILENNSEQQILQFHTKYMKQRIQKQKLILQNQQLKNKIDHFTKELDDAKESYATLCNTLTHSRINIVNLEDRNHDLYELGQQYKQKYQAMQNKNKQLQLELQKMENMKQLMLQHQQSQNDHKLLIESNIAYETKLLEIQQKNNTEYILSKTDLKQAQEIHKYIGQTIQQLQHKFSTKYRQLTQNKQQLKIQLQEIREQSKLIKQKISHQFQKKRLGYQDQIIKLKEQNMLLKQNSEQKIQIVKLNQQIMYLKGQNRGLQTKLKQVQAQINLKKQQKPQKFVQIQQYYDRNGKTTLTEIVQAHQLRQKQWIQARYLKQSSQNTINCKLAEIQQKYQNLKNDYQLQQKQNITTIKNLKKTIQYLQFQLTSQKQSLQRKIIALQKNIKTKRKQIKQKDQFITQYLIQNLKEPQITLNSIIKQIGQYFQKHQQIAQIQNN